jgi:uncharacterized protein
MTNADIFHEGEKFVQERTGERTTALINGRNLSSTIPAAAKGFVGQQVWCVLSASDATGRIWSSLVTGEKGFVSTDDDFRGVTVAPTQFAQDTKSIRPLSELTVGHPVGMLLIETTTRRRLRINGVLTRIDETGFHLSVEESFPACPKFIQRRQPSMASAKDGISSYAPTMTNLHDLADLLSTTDTIFLGSIGPNGRMDASHRGGRPGFALLREGKIWIPDFAGNSMFNTLGNIHLDARCGLVIPDFVNGRQIQLSGHAKVHFDVPLNVELTGGSMRWIEFQVDDDGTAIAALPLNWTFMDASPFNP